MIFSRSTILYGISILCSCMALNGMSNHNQSPTCKVFVYNTMISARSINNENLKTIIENHPDLEVLRLEKCSSLSNDSLAILKNHQNLQALFLIDCPTLTDNSFEFLTTLPHLQAFLITNNHRITDNIFEQLAICTLLKKIYIFSCNNLNGRNLALLNNHINLCELHLSDCQNITIPKELNLPHIEKLNISYNPKINQTCLTTIAQFTSLKSLDLSGDYTVNPEDLHQLQKLPCLEELYLFTPLIYTPESSVNITSLFPHAKKIGYCNRFVVNEVITSIAEGYIAQ